MLQFSFWDILSNLLIATQWTIVLSLIAFFCGGIVGLILGIVSLNQIKNSNGMQTGRGFAIAGIVIGALAIVWVIVAIALGNTNFYFHTD